MEPFLDVKNRDDIYLFDNYIGRLHDERIVKLLAEADWGAMTARLQKVIRYIEHDMNCCPFCGFPRLIEKLLVDEVRIGYCGECSEQIAIGRDGKWLSVWQQNKRSGYARARDIRRDNT